MAILTAWLAVGTATAQSADEIVKRHVRASGGQKRLQAIAGTRYEGVVRVNGGEAQRFTWLARRPDRLYIEMHTASGAHIEAYNGRSGWREDPADGLRTLTGREQTRARATALFRNDRFLTYKKEKLKAGLAGQETIAGRPAYVVELTNPAGIQRRVYFDKETYALLRETQEFGDGIEDILYSDFRLVNGVPEPQRMTLLRAGSRFDVTIDRVEHNPALSDAVFDFPRRAAVDSGAIPALLEQVENNQDQIEKIRENYTYNMVETSIEVDGKGRLKQKSEKTYEVFHLGSGWTLRKLKAKDGRALTAEEQRKEQKKAEEFIETFEKWKKEEPARKAKEEKEKARRRAQGKPEEDDEDFQLSDFMRVARLANPRRERFRGQEVLVFEFSPRPGYKPRNRAESLVQKLGGVVWIDEQARQIARLEARMLDNFRMAGGLLASVHRGSAVVFEQELVHGEVWLPRYAEINFSVRALLLAGFKINLIQKFDQYQRFHVESISEIKAPAVPPPSR
jgi:outer membrane lipoprotein-sorting protein